VICDDKWCAGYGRHEYDESRCPLHTYPERASGQHGQPATAARLWAFFDRTGRLLTATDYEAGLHGTGHALSFHHVGPFTCVEYVRVGEKDKARG